MYYGDETMVHRTSTKIVHKRPISLPPLLILSALLLTTHPGAEARVACQNDTICAEKYRDGSVCTVDGWCSNPFASGCLRRYLGEDAWPGLRACNSDDPPEAAQDGICAESPFDYEEVRILSQNWDSPMLTSWIMQIVSSELLGVPATIETSCDEGFNFYDPDNEFTYCPLIYDFGALRTARKYGDCRKSPRKEPCAQIMLDVWSGQNGAIAEAEEQHVIEPAGASGIVGKYYWYVPKYTAERYPALLSYFGMSTDMLGGEDNRRTLARIFKRPFSWADYCRLFTDDYCASGDDVARRAPKDEDEEGMYFAGDSGELYTGFFNHTKENDCDANPATCTGHIANVPCNWATWVIPQSHYLNISVESNGPQVAGGYSFSQMIQIYRAANATKSDLLFYWYKPDPLVDSFVGTEAEFQQIFLPQATIECTERRVSEEGRCSKDPSRRIGEEVGACDGENEQTKKLIVSNMYENTYSVDEASRSPAYDTLKRMSVSNLEIDQIFRLWFDRKVDRWNFDAREAVCRWTAENVDRLQRLIPRGYPRSLREGSSYDQPYLYAAMAFGALITVLTVLTFWATWFYRNKKVIMYAQVKFLYLLLCGLLFVDIGAIVTAIQPSKATCVSSAWLLVLGYSLEFVPLLVKVAAINRLFQSASKMKRVRIDPKRLFIIVSAFLSIVVIFLVVWTVVDPPTIQTRRVLTDETNDAGGLVVEITHSCASRSMAWKIVVLGYQFLLLVCATVLAFQSRKLRQDFNESNQLAFVIYSNFTFFAIRALIWIFAPDIPSNSYAAVKSFVLSADSFVMLCIYFAPKIWMARMPENSLRDSRARLAAIASYMRTSMPILFSGGGKGSSGKAEGGGVANFPTRSGPPRVVLSDLAARRRSNCPSCSSCPRCCSNDLASVSGNKAADAFTSEPGIGASLPSSTSH